MRRLSGTVVRQPHQLSTKLETVNELSPIDRTTCAENSTRPIDHLHGHHGLQSRNPGTCRSRYVLYRHAQDP